MMRERAGGNLTKAEEQEEDSIFRHSIAAERIPSLEEGAEAFPHLSEFASSACARMCIHAGRSFEVRAVWAAAAKQRNVDAGAI
eukprot:6210231-Pleurochrysis_carterae.AAC.1